MIPYGVPKTELVPEILHTGISIRPGSGVAQDFTGNVSYFVKAGDNSEKQYTVTVINRGQGSFGFTFDRPVDENIAADIPASVITIITVTIQNPGTFDAGRFEWYVDGEKVDAFNGRSSITIDDLRTYTMGPHYVTALVYKNGVPYTKLLTFTVTR
jgi:hypothetical protein